MVILKSIFLLNIHRYMSDFFSTFSNKVYRVGNSKVDHDIILKNEGGTYTFINPYSYSILRKKNHQRMIGAMSMVFIDGILLVKILRVLGIKTERISFDMTSLAPKLFSFCQKKNKTIYFVGTKQSLLEKSIHNIIIEYKDLIVKGYRNGYFDSFEEKNSFQSKIISLNPDYIVVGMGTPLQEEFIIELKNKGYKGTAFTCGGFLHQSSSNLIYYPNWVDKFELRWLYRMFNEKGVMKRILVEYPLFLFRISFDLFIHYFYHKLFKI